MMFLKHCLLNTWVWLKLWSEEQCGRLHWRCAVVYHCKNRLKSTMKTWYDRYDRYLIDCVEDIIHLCEEGNGIYWDYVEYLKLTINTRGWIWSNVFFGFCLYLLFNLIFLSEQKYNFTEKWKNVFCTPNKSFASSTKDEMCVALTETLIITTIKN